VEAGQLHDKDRRMLHALGYAQELSRRMSGFSEELARIEAQYETGAAGTAPSRA
jgi:hypothetical protein